MTTVTPPTSSRVARQAAARTEEAVKIYGTGQTEVRALDGVSVGFMTGSYTAIMGPICPSSTTSG
jgi:putative ABC transport system ATP-binding protein